jgi:DNA-binding MarR family transcriptional regulator
MTGKLAGEIKQKRPFETLEEEVGLALMRTADRLTAGTAEVLRVEDLSQSQYNILRILRGAGGEGLPCGEISARMVRRDPDLTRLLDRLERRGLVSRTRGTADRRVVFAAITAAGLQVLERLDGPVREAASKALAHMPEQRRLLLLELLDEARG